FAAVISRLGSLGEAMEQARSPAATPIDVREDEGRVAYERLTLFSPGNDHVLVRELSVSVPRGTRVLIAGPNDTAKVALFRATAGVWEHGSGRIVRPALDAILFLPERPYLPPGTLRDVLVRTGRSGTAATASTTMTPSSSLQATAGGPGSQSRRDGKASRRALNDREEGFMTLHPLAGQPVPSDMLIDVARLEREYYERKPDPSD